MRHFPLRELGYAVVFVAILVAVYIGTYVAIVRRDIVWHEGPAPSWMIPEIVPTYGAKSDILLKLFEPIHAIDKNLRPDYWSDAAYHEVLTEQIRNLWKPL